MNRALTQAGAAALAIAILAPAAPCLAAEQPVLSKSFSDKSSRTVDVRPGAVLWIDNAIGSITVTGGSDKVVIETTRVLRAADDVTLEALRKKTGVVVEGEPASRIVRSTGLVSNQRASARIDYVVSLPSATAINILSGVAEMVRVSRVTGRVYVRNWRGKIELRDATGVIQIDAVNTNVVASFSQRPVSGGQISSVNGNIELHVPQAAKFEWYAETIKGDLAAAFPVKGRVLERSGQRTFHASVNGGGGATIRTVSITGSVFLRPIENVRALAVSVLPQAPAQAPVSPVIVENDDVSGVYRQVVATLLVEPPSARNFDVRKGRVAGNYDFAANLGDNIFVGQIEGFARIVAAGGEVVLGRVSGDCRVTSQGGPINLGEIGGAVEARTLAGDIKIGRAAKGGQVYTGGGSIDVRATGGPLTVESFGGDVFVGLSSSRVAATTRSGDVRVRLDGKGVTEPTDLRTGRGNVILELPRSAGVNIDATITMAADATYRFESDFPGLTVVRERLGTGMRIHATGKINGGGPPMTITVNHGNVSLHNTSKKGVPPGTR